MLLDKIAKVRAAMQNGPVTVHCAASTGTLRSLFAVMKMMVQWLPITSCFEEQEY